jgi:annexin A7/11
MPSYPSYPGSTNPPYPGSIGFNQSQPSYPGAYPSSTGYPSSQPNYPGQPSYNSGSSSGLFDPYPSSAPQPGYLPPHIANNPNFQPSQPPQTHNLYPTQPNPMSFGQQPPTQPAFPGATNLGSGGNFGPTSQPNVQPYQAMTFTPTLRPHQPFNPNDDATRLYKAMKGIGTDETALIDVLCKRTYDQRLEISRAYKASYGKVKPFLYLFLAFL